ncbi:MAG TPA: hypothetical protein VMM18_00140, partial [Gemmatimonadaceae bacterium]|nr:hypothetical protein [Gemmatimonadaceae bacterium]
APWWDPVWIRDERLDDPDTVLEARTQLWHIGRVTHALTVSDILAGEAGTVEISEHDYASLGIAYGSPPVRRARVDAEVSWEQTASGTLDVSGALIAAFGVAGSPAHVISSWTGQGLEEDWPEKGDDLNGGWSVGRATLARADGVWREPRYRDVHVGNGVRLDDGIEGDAAEAFVSAPVTARFFLWEFSPRLVLAYGVSRSRVERLTFEITADVQPVFAEPGDEEEIVIALGSRNIGEEIDGVLPIGDPRRSAYLRTDRGRRSIDYLIALARAKLLARARAAEVKVVVPFAEAVGLSSRHSATIIDDRIPDGSATGKVIHYALRADGVGEDKSVTRAVIYTIGVSLIMTAVTGGVFIGTMRAHISMNTEQIVQNRVEFFQRFDRIREEQINQDEQLNRVQGSLIELTATVNATHDDVQNITGWVEEERRGREQRGQQYEHQKR